MNHRFVLLLLVMGGPAFAQPIGRLFTTPQERQQLDIARGLLPPPAAAPAPAAPIAPEPVTVNGFVRRSSGKSTVWLNQQPADGARVNGKNVSVTLPSGRRINVKPGQSINLNDGTLIEAPKQ